MKTNEPILRITDGYTVYNLISKDRHGISLFDWTPATSGSKDGGVWANSPLTDGRQLVYRKLDNVIETFHIRIGAESQDMAISMLTQLTNILEAGVGYWTSGSRMSIPTWIEAKGPEETNTRYAMIYDYRIPELDNPFATPFFNVRKGVSMDEITLIIERGQWQETPIGESVCVEYSAFQADAPVIEKRTVFGNVNDAYTYSGNLYDLPYNSAGYMLGGLAISGYRFSSGFNVDNSQLIRSAVFKVPVLDVLYPANIDPGSKHVKLRVRASIGADLSTYANFNASTRTTAFEILRVPLDTAYGAIMTVDIKELVQELVNRPAWVAGTQINIFIEGYSGTEYAHWVYFATYNSHGGDIDNATLKVEWDEDRGVSEPNCLDGYIANQYTQAQITNVIRYDASATSYSSNLLSTTSYDLLPDPVAVGDILYIGCNSNAYFTYDMPFCNVVLNLSTMNIAYSEGNGITGVWELYRGAPTSGWTTLDVTDRTIEKGDPRFTGETFSREGVCGIFFEQKFESTLGTWSTVAINGITAYWIRFRVTAVSSPITPVQNGYIYCVTWPNIKVMGSQVPGDIPALASLTLTGESYYDGSYGDSNANNAVSRIYVSVWPYIDTVEESLEYWNTGWKDKRSNFQPYLPTNSYVGQSYGVLDFNSGTDTLRDSAFLPATSGYCSLWTTGAASEPMLERAIWYLDTDVYRGTFRVFVRVVQKLGTAGDFIISAASKYGAISQFTKSVPTKLVSTNDLTYWNLLDLGELTFPPFADKLSRTDYVNDQYCKLSISASCESTTFGRNLYINDVILMPTDNFMGVFSTINENIYNVMVGRSLEIDSVHSQYSPIRAVSRQTYNDNTIVSFWEEINNGPFVLTQNRVNKIFTLAGYFDNTSGAIISNPSICFGVNLNKSSRYLSMRGKK